MGDVAEPINLRGHVVADEQSAAMPSRAARVAALRRGEWEVFLALDASRRPEAYDFSRAVTGPLIGIPIICQPKIIGLALPDQLQGRQAAGVGHLIKSADLILLPPDPAPTFAFGPLFHARVLRGYRTERERNQTNGNNQRSKESHEVFLPRRLASEGGAAQQL